MWIEIVLWCAVGLLGLILLYFLLVMLMAGIIFALLYGRVHHTYSRRALFSDFPEIGVERQYIRRRRKRLAVYLIGDKTDKGLVIISYGIRDRGEGYFTEARAFLARGYRVLLYDAVGSGNSSGRSQRGLPQSATDLHDVLTWAERNPCFQGLDFYLYGHSWGGYAVCAVFQLGAHPRVKAVCSLSGFNDPCRMMLESGSVLSDHFGRFVYPPMCLLQFLQFGRAMFRTAEKGILAAKCRFLILHAEEDQAIKADGAGIYARRKKLASERVQFRLIYGRHHLNGWLEEKCCEANARLDSAYHAIVGKYGFRMSKKQERTFYSHIGREERLALSIPDENYFNEIDAFFMEEV